MQELVQVFERKMKRWLAVGATGSGSVLFLVLLLLVVMVALVVVFLAV